MKYLCVSLYDNQCAKEFIDVFTPLLKCFCVVLCSQDVKNHRDIFDPWMIDKGIDDRYVVFAKEYPRRGQT